MSDNMTRNAKLDFEGVPLCRDGDNNPSKRKMKRGTIIGMDQNELELKQSLIQ